MKRIFLPVDGSEHSKRAVAKTAELAQLSGGEVRVFHFQEREPSKAGIATYETTAEAQQLVDDALADLKPLKLKRQARPEQACRVSKRRRSSTRQAASTPTSSSWVLAACRISRPCSSAASRIRSCTTRTAQCSSFADRARSSRPTAAHDCPISGPDGAGREAVAPLAPSPS
jgi:hypothetical protein